MAETITPTPLRVSNSATKPILRMLVSLSSREKPRPLERLVRTMSPSRTSTWPNLVRSSLSTISAMVVLPAPERPVNHSVKPRRRASLVLAPFSISSPSSFYLLLLLEHAGLFDHLLLLAQTLYEDLNHLGATELRWWIFSLGEHLPNPGPGEEDVRIFAVRAGVGRGHHLAVEAEEGVLEEERCHAQLLFLELLEDVLGIIGAVVAAYPSVIAAHDEVRAAVVLATDGVEDGLPWSRIPHSRREDRQDGAVFRIVALQDDLVGSHPHRSRDVV